MTYEVNGVTYSSDSGKNQRILDMLVNREVYCCMTQEIEYILSRIYDNYDNSPFDENDLDLLLCCEDEIYEWWAVSTWLGEKLKEQGCVVIDSYCKSYWGRCTTGQSISLDCCMANIAKDMGILEGMEYDWSNNEQ